MEQNQNDNSIASDVLHNEDHSKLTPEEIAKALAHHKKRHGGDPQQGASEKKQQGKKQTAGKP
jgi:hypothetical protein